MTHLRWFALLPSVGGLAVSLSALTAGSPSVMAQDMYRVPAVQMDTFEQAHMTQARQTEAIMASKMWHRREVAHRKRIEHRREVRREQRRAARLAAERAAQVSTPTAAPSGQVGTGGMGAFEACVIQRESGGNPTAVNPYSGAGGLFQFLPSTWAGLGLGYPGGAQTAPVSVQEEGFDKLYAEAGTSPWASDGC